ncbi:MAG: Uma2 family endonuclease [Turicibacter sp.]|nr:Uma2 family endonuclease [Turicibacter sp.]
MDRMIEQSQDIYFHPTTDRHSDLVFSFAGELRPLRRRGELEVIGDTVALVYNGDGLINVNDFTFKEAEILKRQLNQFSYVEPDIMVFKENVSLNNQRNTRKAGCPDLIIEIWSDKNDLKHREFKKNLYSSSMVTEHWYLEQENDIVECYLGKKRLPDQHLRNVLKTQNGLEFDMRDLQTLDDTSWKSFVENGYKGE